MTDLEDTPRTATGDPAPSAPAPEDADRSLRQRITDRWNRPGFTGKASVILGAAAVVAAAVGGIYALVNLSDDEDDDGLGDRIAGILSPTPADDDTSNTQAAEEQKADTAGQDATSPRYTTPSWTSNGYTQNRCPNTRRHQDGCEHTSQDVASSTKRRSKDLLAEDDDEDEDEAA
ncbi:hypothetical protein ACFVVA_28080 [Kitasatospora sp. NPDC058048]|uniref:hypothetical protein n=1 Tax=Kitasatospora sp. NPDC058048 TaxID=3346313 RepID=UPI0036D913BE